MGSRSQPEMSSVKSVNFFFHRAGTQPQRKRLYRPRNTFVHGCRIGCGFALENPQEHSPVRTRVLAIGIEKMKIIGRYVLASQCLQYLPPAQGRSLKHVQCTQRLGLCPDRREDRIHRKLSVPGQFGLAWDSTGANAGAKRQVRHIPKMRPQRRFGFAVKRKVTGDQSITPRCLGKGGFGSEARFPTLDDALRFEPAKDRLSILVR
jgi:hypothetical protein